MDPTPPAILIFRPSNAVWLVWDFDDLTFHFENLEGESTLQVLDSNGDIFEGRSVDDQFIVERLRTDMEEVRTMLIAMEESTPGFDVGRLSSASTAQEMFEVYAGQI